MEDQEKAEVVAVEAEEYALSPDTILRESEARAELMATVSRGVVKACHQRNIIDMGGNPYITDDGCEKIARAAGISFSSPVVKEYWDKEGKAPEWCVEIEGTGTMFGQTITDFGCCTSADSFIANRKISIPQMRNEVKKKAYANWRGRIVRGMLGLKELTWAELNSIGFEQGSSARVEYEKGATSGKSDGGDDARKKLGEMMLKDCKDDKAAAGELLEILTSFIGKDDKPVKGKSSIAKLTDKQAGYGWGNYKPGGKERENYELQLAEILRTYGLDKAEK